MAGSGVDVDNGTFEVRWDEFCPEIPHIICVHHLPLNITRCGFHFPGVLHSMLPTPMNPQSTPLKKAYATKSTNISSLSNFYWHLTKILWDWQKDISDSFHHNNQSLYLQLSTGHCYLIVQHPSLKLNSLLVFLALLQGNVSQCSGLTLALWSLITLGYLKRLWLTLTSVN